MDRGNPVLGQKRKEGGFSPFKIMGGEGKCCSLPFGLWCILAYSTKVPKNPKIYGPLCVLREEGDFFEKIDDGQQSALPE